GMEVSNTENIPDGMIVYVAPASKYAKFTHYGSLDKLSETYTYIYNVWFPQSGYDMGMEDGLELYGKNFDPQSSKSEMYIFVPIK
ncbi:MAG: GyrI-like domain-containing protein, partial [Candidatus Celaenobacter polaris]|nr:GyrI-like domain-containing protein [Candidatus Celaenobacter polaris]